MSGSPGSATAQWPAWLRRAVAIGPIVGSLMAGGLLYLPSHDAGTSIGTSVLFFVVLGGLRAADPVLRPVWILLAQVPGWIRWPAAVGMPILLSMGRFGSQAAGAEVSTARSSLLIATIVAYVLLRPSREDASQAQARSSGGGW